MRASATWLTLEPRVWTYDSLCPVGWNRQGDSQQAKVPSKTVTSEDASGPGTQPARVTLSFVNAASMFPVLFCECGKVNTCFMKEFDAGIFLGEQHTP